MFKFIERYGVIAIACVMLIVLLTSMESGQAEVETFSELKNNVEEIVNEADTDGNIGVFIETSEGIININETEVMSSASVIKVPILAEAVRQAERGDLVWDDEVLVEASDAVGGSGVIRDMDLPVVMPVRELAELMMTVSDNTATNMIAERVGFDQINWTCIELGCEETVMQNSIYTSMPQDRGPHNYTTAKDMATVVAGVINKDIFSQEGKEEFLRIMREVPDGRLTAYKDPEIHGDIQTGRKGGSTASPRVLHDVGVFTLGEEEIYAAVLTHNVVPNTATPTIAEIGKVIMDYMVEND
ncbi:serine hydrolase [Virgibacillus oceani]